MRLLITYSVRALMRTVRVQRTSKANAEAYIGPRCSGLGEERSVAPLCVLARAAVIVAMFGR